MSHDDSELPVSATFMELIDSAQANELAQIEEQRRKERLRSEQLRALNKAGMTASEAFLTTVEETDRRKERTIVKTLDQLTKEAAQAVANKESKDAQDDAFPPPPIL